jgi:hypothetical protein
MGFDFPRMFHGRAVVKQSMVTTGILTATLFGGLIDVAKGGVILNGVAADQTTFFKYAQCGLSEWCLDRTGQHFNVYGQSCRS